MKIAVIPARGGSKRIPRKNVKDFCGKPMLAYAIEAAVASKSFDHIVLSTDDMEIAGIGEALGAEAPFIRPAALADDMTPTVPVIGHAITECNKLGWKATHVCCIYPTNPFLHADDIRAAFNLLMQNDCSYTFPVTPLPTAQGFLRLDPDGVVSPFIPEYARMRSQDIEPVYFDAGQFYWGKAEAWLSQQDVFSSGKAVIIPQHRAVDIDTPDDWEWAEHLFAVMMAEHGGCGDG